MERLPRTNTRIPARLGDILTGAAAVVAGRCPAVVMRCMPTPSLRCEPHLGTKRSSMNHLLDVLNFCALPPMVPLVVAGCWVVLLPVAMLVRARFRRILVATMVLWIVLPTVMSTGLFGTVTPWLVELGRFCYLLGVIGLTILVGYELVNRHIASRRNRESGGTNNGVVTEPSGRSDPGCADADWS